MFQSEFLVFARHKKQKKIQIKFIKNSVSQKICEKISMLEINLNNNKTNIQYQKKKTRQTKIQSINSPRYIIKWNMHTFCISHNTKKTRAHK